MLRVRRSEVMLAGALAVFGLLAACGSGGRNEARATVTVRSTVTETETDSVGAETLSVSPPPAPTTARRAPVLGKKFTNLGATVTLTAVKSATTVTLDGKNTPAGSGAKYVIIHARVQNDAKTGMDLTCSYPIANKLIDDQDREFDAIADLYKILGNPECNADLQPGFAETMIWIYRVPASAHIAGWSFADATDMSTIGTNDSTVIEIAVPGA